MVPGRFGEESFRLFPGTESRFLSDPSPIVVTVLAETPFKTQLLTAKRGIPLIFYRTSLGRQPLCRPGVMLRRFRDLCSVRGRPHLILLVQAWTGPENSRRLRLPDFITNGT